MKRIGIVSNSYNSNVAVQLHETERALRQFDVQTRIVEARAAEEYDRAFASLAEYRVDGVIPLSPTRLWWCTVKGSQSLRKMPRCRPFFSAVRTCWPAVCFRMEGALPINTAMPPCMLTAF